MERYVFEDGKTLRLGYTTGTAAALASLGAARYLLTGKRPEKVSLLTPKGIEVLTDVSEASRTEDCAVCAVKKDGGDDQDVTNGLLICARVERSGQAQSQRVILLAGEGIGTVTKPGLSVAVGEPAINPVPRRMIEEAVLQAMAEADFTGQLTVTIFVPQGEAAARSTFNERLGVTGGISIIGTTGIVEPMSKKAYAEVVCLEIRQQAALGRRHLILTPGNYGADFLQSFGDTRTSGGELLTQESAVVMCSNFIGEALDEAISDDYKTVLLIGHAGKLVKLAGGIMNTHSRMADCRMELICAHAAISGAGEELCQKLMAAVTTDEAFLLLEQETTVDVNGNEASLKEKTVASLLRAIDFHLRERFRKHEKSGQQREKEPIRIGALLFTGSGNSLPGEQTEQGYQLLGITETGREIIYEK
ncbi:MAG: cobalt-precorrin-5B (C(1))-methyltransferase CbiD [Lachnospiraceae bacterium]|nr:cobalt-precorrin-5B (C(1))-methyltransferase CbiD [Lachnospiraceae bacterium]